MWTIKLCDTITQNSMKQFLQTKCTVHILFIVISVFFGLFFVFVTPLLWGADETTHVGRVYQISQGHVSPEKVHEGYSGYGYGGTIPSNLMEVINYVNYDFNVNTHQVIAGVKYVDNPSQYRIFANLPLSGRQVQYNFSNTAIYSPISYIPSVIGFKVAEIFKLHIGPSIWLGRICDLAFYIAVLAFVLRALRAFRVKWVIFAIALLPMTLYQASIITADTVTNALAFAIVGLVLKALLSKDRLTKAETIVLALSALALPVAKPSYLFISLIAILVPVTKIPVRHYKRFILPIAIVLGLLALVVWQYETRYLSNASKWIIAGVVPWWTQIDSGGQIKYILGHPLSIVVDFVRTTILNDIDWFTGMFGRLGFDYVQVPAMAIIASISALVMSAVGSETMPMRRKHQLFIGAVMIATTVTMFAIFYVTISAVGMSTIQGIQGRYFLPLLPVAALLLLTMTRTRLAFTKDSYRRFTAALTCLVIFSLLVSAIKFYYITWG